MDILTCFTKQYYLKDNSVEYGKGKNEKKKKKTTKQT